MEHVETNMEAGHLMKIYMLNFLCSIEQIQINYQ